MKSPHQTRASATAPIGIVQSPAASSVLANADHEPVGRWNIRQLLCFSHDGRRRNVDLVPGTVNIITGNSHTGKSALVDLIDYVMGSQDCTLPGRVFTSTAWVGVLWELGVTQCLICRRVPERGPRGTDDFVYRVGTDLAVPEDAGSLARTMGRDQMLKRFEALLGIGDVKTEVFGSETNTPVRVSFRNAMPYLLQDAAHIINRTFLLRGLDTQQRQHLLDTLPYYLGVIDESMVGREAELRQLRTRITAAERREAEQRAIVGESSATARALVREALDAGLIAAPPVADASNEAVNAALRAAVERPTDLPELFTSDEALNRLYERERELAAEGGRLRARIEATRRVLEAAGGFRDASDSQRQRLEVVELLPDSDTGTCPLCTQPLHDRVESPGAVRRAVERIRRELGEVARERPKLDGALAELEGERGRIARDLAETRFSIANTVQASDERQSVALLDRQRLHVAGRISLFLQTAAPIEAVGGPTEDLEALRSQAEVIAMEVNADAKLEALAVARLRLSALATEVVAELPLEARYTRQPIDVNLRTLMVSVLTARRGEEMRAIGSDENCLTLHVAVLLAFHRMFAERRRPIPGFLLFDQLSRPYYPATGDATEEEVASSAPDVASLKQYFDSLFHETERGEGLQVLVLEHAYFSDDSRFRGATRERWVRGHGLIPADWPDRE